MISRLARLPLRQAYTPFVTRMATPSLRLYSNQQQSPSSRSNQSENKPEQQQPSDSQPSEGEQSSASKLHNLPDLTQGIPSTLEFEARAKAAKSSSSSSSSSTSALTPQQWLDEKARDAPGSEYISSAERKQDALARWSFIAVLVSLAGAGAYMGRDWATQEEIARHPNTPNGWTPAQWYARAKVRMSETVTYYHEPAFDKLLPKLDPLYEKPYTLCISLEDMLVHSEWTREHGWRVAKRPGVDYFLRYLSQYYELVLFTSVPAMTAQPIVQKMDPFQVIMFPLFREATKYEDGEVVKDLAYLNRDLSKVIILDTKASHVRKQPENAIILPPWTGNAQDKELVSLVPFLEYIHTMQYGDVRKVLHSFEGKHIPTEFARREAIARAQFQQQLKEHKAKSTPSGVGFLSNALGLKASNLSMTAVTHPDDEITPSEAFAQGKMIQDIARERGQRYYERLEKDLRENGAKYLQEAQAIAEKQQQEAVNDMMGSFATMFLPKEEANQKK